MRAPIQIDRDLPCIKCDYNLRGLNSGGLCPECGAPIEPSLADDLSKAPSWAEQSYDRAATAMSLAPVEYVFLFLLFFLFSSDSKTGCPFVVAFWDAFAAWLFYSRRPSGFETNSDRRRISAILVIRIAIVAVCLALQISPFLANPWHQFLGPLFAVLVAANAALAHAWCRSIAHHLGRRSVAWRFAILMWAVPILIMLACALGWRDMIRVPRGFDVLPSLLVLAILIVLEIVAIVMRSSLKKDLRSAIRAAGPYA